MWDVLKEYPAARVRLEAIAVKRLEKYKRAPLEKGKKYHSIRSLKSALNIYHMRLLIFQLQWAEAIPRLGLWNLEVGSRLRKCGSLQ